MVGVLGERQPWGCSLAGDWRRCSVLSESAVSGPVMAGGMASCPPRSLFLFLEEFSFAGYLLKSRDVCCPCQLDLQLRLMVSLAQGGSCGLGIPHCNSDPSARV